MRASRMGCWKKAKASKKLRPDFTAETEWSRNTPQRLRESLAPFRSDGTLPDYPLGSDFTEVEQRLVKALGWLKANTATTSSKLRTALRALAARSDDHDAMARMGLQQPRGFSEKLEARLVALGLRETSVGSGGSAASKPGL